MTQDPNAATRAELPTREDLLVACEQMRFVLTDIARHVTTDEGDAERTEEDIGLFASEVVEMAHDNMIESARRVLKCDAVRRVFKRATP